MQDPAILPHRFYPQHVGLSNSILMIYLKNVGLKIALLRYTQRRNTQQNHTLDIIKDCRTQRYHSKNIGTGNSTLKYTQRTQDLATASSNIPKECRTQQQNFQNIFKHTVRHYCLQDIPREWNTQQCHKQGVATECRISNIALRRSKECITQQYQNI